MKSITIFCILVLVSAFAFAQEFDDLEASTLSTVAHAAAKRHAAVLAARTNEAHVLQRDFTDLRRFDKRDRKPKRKKRKRKRKRRRRKRKRHRDDRHRDHRKRKRKRKRRRRKKDRERERPRRRRREIDIGDL